MVQYKDFPGSNNKMMTRGENRVKNRLIRMITSLNFAYLLT